MARVYSRAKGKAGSKRPLRTAAPTWVRYKPKEVELLVSKLAKEGKTPSQIGLVLRDSYGVPSVRALTGKRITKVFEEKGAHQQIPEDLMALIKQNVITKKQLERHKPDMTAKRGLEIVLSKIKRLTNYYKRTGRLPQAWTYDPEKVKLMVE